MAFQQRITKIQGLSDKRRLPRLGVIRLGIKKKSAKTGKEYPAETDYFVVPPEVAKVFGETPKELEIMLPVNSIDDVFPQSLKWYGSGKGLKCHGDMKRAYRYNPDDKDWYEMECPCEHLDNGCKQSATLMIMIPKVSVGGVYQIRTSSYNSIIDINSGIDYVEALLGRFALVPLTLKRDQTETHHDEKKQIHYTMKIILNADINTLNLLRGDTQRILESPRYQLPAPIEENPKFDPVDVIVDEEEPVTYPEVAPEPVDHAEGQVKPEANPPKKKKPKAAKNKLAALKQSLQKKMVTSGVSTAENQKALYDFAASAKEDHWTEERFIEDFLKHYDDILQLYLEKKTHAEGQVKAG